MVDGSRRLDAPWIARPPRVEEVVGQRQTLDVEVGAASIDVNGHMNFRHYLDLGSQAVEPILDGELGLGSDYVEASRHAAFVVEHHMRYYAEASLGHRITGHVLPPTAAGRSFTLVAGLLNCTTGRVSYVLSTTYVHVDLETRTAAPFPQDLADRLMAVGTGPAPIDQV